MCYAPWRCLVFTMILMQCIHSADLEMCRSKIGQYPPEEFNTHACSWCYFFLFRTENKPLGVSFADNYLEMKENRTGYQIGTKLKPDFKNDSVTNIICSTLTSDECEMWTLCCEDAKKCCSHQLETASQSNQTHCLSTWDGYACWSNSAPGEKSYITCPRFLKHSIPTRKAVKLCSANGDWSRKQNREWTDYTLCLNYQEYRTTIYISVGCQIASLALLVPALFVFLFYKCLRSQHRIRLHINFFISFILSGTFIILWNILVTLDKLTNVNTTDTLIYKNSGICKFLSFMKLYFTSTNYVWMFCEGFYLYRLIVNAFSPPKRLLYLYIAGWGVPFIFSLAYAVVRLLIADERHLLVERDAAFPTRHIVLCCHQLMSGFAIQIFNMLFVIAKSASVFSFNRCWAISLGGKEWIIYAPNLACLVANLFFLCAILRILLTQIQVHPNEPSNFRRALKATFVLIPLFGVQLVVTIYRVPQEMAGALHYERFSEVVSNSQVATHIKRWWRHTRWSRLPGNKTCNNATITVNFNMSMRAVDHTTKQESPDEL